MSRLRDVERIGQPRRAQRRITQIYGATNQIQRVVMARALLR